MVKRFLPIYHTGWFYLLLLFWGFSFWYASIGGLNQINQLNIQWLSQLKPSPVLSDKKPSLDVNDVLTLHSEFNDQDIKSVTTLLSYYPNSQITLLGQQSSNFMKKLEAYLSSKPRNSKIVIGSSQVSSASPLKSQATMPFSPLLNWFRFSSNTNTEMLSSKYFIFSPFLQSERQTFPLVWQQKGMLYLSLPGEIVKQLSPNTELLIQQNWQLSLIKQKSTLAPEKSPLGFFGEVFIPGNLSSINEENQERHVELNDSLPRLATVTEFIQQYSPTSNNRPKYKVIFITDNRNSQDKILKPLVNKLVQNDYVYQSLVIILFAWLLLLLGISLTWFIGRLSLKQQSISVLSYVLLLYMLQYFFFNQQQWLEVTPIIMVIMGTWLLLFAYQKEYKLFLAALNYHATSNTTDRYLASSNAKASSKVKPKVKVGIKSKIKNLLTNKRVKSVQVKHSASLSEENTNEASHNQFPPVNRPSSVSENDIEQTLAIVDTPVNSKTSMNHQMSVENFGRYQVEGVLGKGAMGIVYQGVDPKINRHVAIKTLQLSNDIDSPEFGEAKARFFREAQTAGGLSHANIVTIYDVGEDNHLGYIAMDLLTGAPLSLFTQVDKLLPTPLVYQLLIQITDALEYAHQQNVVHRDIKPANIIYDDDLFKVTVTDFGIAYVSDNSNTRTGIIMGSPYYMSPEQILGLKVDGRSDIFSLGVTFYQLLCGHLPFEGESIATVAYQITKAKAIAVNQRNTNLPTSAMRICSKAMHKDIDKRFQSMSEFKLALANALKRDFKITAN